MKINMKINMKRVGITFSRYQKELEKLNNQLERAKEAYEKKYANAAKYGVQDWDSIAYCEWLETTEKTESDSLINKADVKKNGAWWDLFYSENKVKDITAKIKIAEEKLKEAKQEFQKYYNELEKSQI